MNTPQGVSGPSALQTLLTVRDVATWLRVHEKTIYEWAEKGKLPCFKLGNRLRFDASDVSRWLQARKEGV
jgi:PTS system nitrogen regulatory IIA component